MRYLCVVSYRGTSYCGWQKQVVSKLPSIEKEIEKVLSRILNENIKIYGSGRTDAGVHAIGQTFHFDFARDLDEYKYTHSFNELLPDDIRILSLTKVSDDFHARFSVKSKTYVYKINNSRNINPFASDLEYHLPYVLDVNSMKEASKVFIGEHNFQNFTSKEEDDSLFVRIINNIEVTKENGIVTIALTGNGFMRYMVRMIVGNLIQIGLGKLTSEDLKRNLEDKNRRPSSFKAPASGLYLKEVFYN